MRHISTDKWQLNYIIFTYCAWSKQCLQSPHVWIQSEIACHRAKIASQYMCNKKLKCMFKRVQMTQQFSITKKILKRRWNKVYRTNSNFSYVSTFIVEKPIFTISEFASTKIACADVERPQLIVYIIYSQNRKREIACSILQIKRSIFFIEISSSYMRDETLHETISILPYQYRCFHQYFATDKLKSMYKQV